jgi:hypothetical protein
MIVLTRVPAEAAAILVGRVHDAIRQAAGQPNLNVPIKVRTTAEKSPQMIEAHVTALPPCLTPAKISTTIRLECRVFFRSRRIAIRGCLVRIH